MAEPADHMLRLLREMRNDINEHDESLSRKLDSMENKVDKGFADLRESIDSVAEAIAGEMVTRRHTGAKVDERLAALEKRVTKLERRR